MSYYRGISEKVIAEVVAANVGLDKNALRKQISKAYPFGIRAHWPYVMWCKCVKEYFQGPKKEEKQVEEIEEGGLFGNITKEQA